MRRNALLISAAPSILLFLASAASAQTAATVSPGAQIQEIVVTAEKRTSTAQKTAATIDVVTSEALQRRKVTELSDLNSLLPSGQIISVVNSLQVSIRGIGSDFIDPRADPGVALSVNGLFFDRPIPNGFAFLDVSRVEVLNGPQGTLSGRNAAAGAVNIITNQPVNEYAGSIQFTGGNFGENDLSIVLNAPVGDTLSLRAAYERDRRNGYIGNYYDDIDSDTSRLSAKWTPTPKLTIYAEGDYLRTGGHGSTSESWPCPGSSPWSLYVPAACANGGPGGQIPTDSQVGTFIDAGQLHIDYDLDWATLSSISGYVGTHDRYTNLPNGIQFNETTHDDNYDYTEELRLAGHDNAGHQGGIAWQVGTFLFDSTGNYDLTVSNPNIGATIFPKLPQNSEAGFAQVTYGLSDRLRLTGGIRFTHDFRGLSSAAGTLAVKNDNVSYKGGLEYDLAPGKLLYATISSGYVSGGINGGSLSAPTAPDRASPTFQPETITAYEVGSKNRFLSGRLQLNASAYYYSFNNYQYTQPAFLNVGNATNLVIDNIGAVKTYGLELSTIYALTADDRLSASLYLAEGSYGKLSFVTFGGNPVTGLSPALVTAPSGAPLVNLPNVSGLIGYEHTWHLSGGSTVIFGINSKISERYYLVPGSTDPSDMQKGYARTDANIGYMFGGGVYTIRAWVKNIENVPVNTYGQTAGAHNYGILEPRTYGVTLAANF